MPALRPLVLVYQEFAQQSYTAEAPSLVTLIAGPSYHIMDSPDDSALTAAGSYGSSVLAQGATESSAQPYIPGEIVLTLASPPGNALGALLDASSLQLHFTDAQVLIPGSTGTAGAFSVSPDDNLFTGDGGETFAALGVRPGDRLVSTGTSGPEETTAHTILEVGGYNGSTLLATQLRTSTNYFASGTDIAGAAYVAGVPTARNYRVERTVAIAPSDTPAQIAVSGNQITIKGGHTVTVTGLATTTAYVISADMHLSYMSLRQDLADVNVIEDPRDIETLVGKVDERNPLAVALFLAMQNTNTPLQYFGLPNDDLNGDTDILQGYLNMFAAIEARKDTYAIVPLTSDLAVIAALKTAVNGASQPEVSKFQIGIGSLDTLPTTKVILADATGTTESVSADVIDVFVTGVDMLGVSAGDEFGVTSATAATIDGGYTIVASLDSQLGVMVEETIAAAAANDATALWWVYSPSNTTTVVALSDVQITTATETIGVANASASALHAGSVIELVGLIAANLNLSLHGNNRFYIVSVGAADSHGVGFTAYTLAMSSAWVTSQTLVTGITGIVREAALGGLGGLTSRKAFRQVLDLEGTFITDDAIVGDLVEVTITPSTLTAGDYASLVFTYPIESIISDNRVVLAPGSDIPTGNGATGAIDYRVIRSLSKAGQVEELVAIVESLSDSGKRIVMTWPDQLKLSGVVNNATGVQSWLPGYYGAVVVGAMSAGLPPQQGFTNIGIAGVQEINHSTRYFSEAQLTTLSNAGIYLFAQERRTTLPYCVHQLTTDVSTTENGELSVVRSFDFASRFYKDIVDDFIGRYNVITEVLGQLRDALNGGTRYLQTLKLPNIGAPIVSATVDSIAVLPGTTDRVEIYMTIELPKPFNRAGLHLVA